MFDPFTMSDSLQQRFRDEIDRGEQVRWVMQPQPSGKTPGFAWFLVVMGVFDVAFMLFWIAGASGLLWGNGGLNAVRAPNLIFAAFGLPGLAMGVALLTSPWWIRRRAAKAAAGTLYVVTDRRAIIFNGGYHGNEGLVALAGFFRMLMPSGIVVQTFRPDQLQRIERIERDDGSGDLILGESESNVRVNGRPMPLRIGFFSIPDVRKVHRMLDELAARARPETAT